MPDAAIALAFAGISLGLRVQARPNGLSKTRLTISRWLAIAVILLGMSEMTETITGKIFGLDQLVSTQELTSVSRLMGLTTGFNLICVGFGLLLLERQGRASRLLTQWLIIIVTLVCSFALMSYLPGWKTHYEIAPAALMAFPAIPAFLGLSGGILLARPEHSLIVLLVDSRLAGRMARRLLPIALILPLVIGWVAISAERVGLFPSALGTSVVAAIYICILTGLAWWIATLLRLMDLERRQTEAQLRIFCRAVEQSPASMILTDSAGLIQHVNRKFTEVTGYTLDEVRGKNPRILKSGNTPPEVYADLWWTVTQGREWCGELENRKKNGEIFFESASISPIADDSGKISHYLAIKNDVTERKETDKNLRKLSERLLLATRTANVGIWDVDVSSGALFWDDVMYTLYGKTSNTFNSSIETWQASLHPEDRARATQEVQRALSGEKEFNTEFRIVLPDKSVRYIRAIALVGRHGSGKATRMVGTNWDITESKEAEQRLVEALNYNRILLENSPIGMITCGESGKIVSANPAIGKMIGASREQILTQNFRELESWKRSKLLESAEAALLTGQMQICEAYHESTFGRRIWLSAQFVPFDHEQKRHLLGLFTDITARKEAEESLRKSEERLELAMRGANDGLWDWNLETNAVYYSPRWKSMLGYAAGELDNNAETWRNLLHPDDRSVSGAKVRDLIDGRVRQLEVEFRLRHKAGHYVDILSRGFLFRQPGQPIRVIGTHVDITERKRAELQLRETHNQLIAASRQAGMAEVATGVLHNVGNVLNSVNISTTVLLEQIRKCDAESFGKLVTMFEEHRDAFGSFFESDPKGKLVLPYMKLLAQQSVVQKEALLREVQRLQQNISHMKDVVAIQQNLAKVGGATEIVRLSELVDETLALNRDTMSKHGIQIIRRIEDVAPITVDKHKLLQILINLIHNARQACDAVMLPDKKLTVAICAENDRVEIEVTDNGVGIAPENLSRIFNHGFTTKKNGHGFGLHSAAISAHEMGGTLSVRSEGVNRGATFKLNLPLLSPKRSHD